MDRKEIVKTLENHFKVKSQYLGVPSFAYQIETADEIYTIDREGKIINSTEEEVELEELLSSTEVELADKILDLEVSLPMEGHSGRTLVNLVNMIFSKQFLIKKAFSLKGDLVEEDFSTAINEVQIETLEDLKQL